MRFHATLTLTLVLGMSLVCAGPLAAVEPAQCVLVDLKGNPEMPTRDADHRISHRAFFQRAGTGAQLELCSAHIVPDNNFGSAKPGDRFGSSWLVKAVGADYGINHKSAPWPKAVMECRMPDGSVLRVPPDRGCGCGGTADYSWTISASTPPGTHTVRVSWEWPGRSDQTLEQQYQITVVNPDFGATEDTEIAALEKQHPGKVLVLQNGRELAGETYQGCQDIALTWGGYEGDRTGIIRPTERMLGIGYWIVNQKASRYQRGLIAFDLAPLQGERIAKAYLKLSVRPKQNYLPEALKQPLPVYAAGKPWREVNDYVRGDRFRGSVHTRHRDRFEGLPNCHFSAYPQKWEQKLASGPGDHGEQIASLVHDEQYQNVVAATRADVTETVRAWVAGDQPNYGFLVGPDLPAAIADAHPGKGGKVAEYKQVYGGGLVPFCSSQEPVDLDYRPRLIVVLE